MDVAADLDEISRLILGEWEGTTYLPEKLVHVARVRARLLELEAMEQRARDYRKGDLLEPGSLERAIQDGGRHAIRYILGED